MSKKRMVLLDQEVYDALKGYASSHGYQIKGLCSIVIAEALRNRGVDISYPKRKRPHTGSRLAIHCLPRR